MKSWQVFALSGQLAFGPVQGGRGLSVSPSSLHFPRKQEDQEGRWSKWHSGCSQAGHMGLAKICLPNISQRVFETTVEWLPRALSVECCLKSSLLSEA